MAWVFAATLMVRGRNWTGFSLRNAGDSPDLEGRAIMPTRSNPLIFRNVWRGSQAASQQNHRLAVGSSKTARLEPASYLCHLHRHMSDAHISPRWDARFLSLAMHIAD